VDEKKGYSIEQVAALCGMTPSVIRAWELRYDWPRPKRRKSNGYRVYSPLQVEQLCRAKKLRDLGHSPQSFIVDGLFHDIASQPATTPAAVSRFEPLAVYDPGDVSAAGRLTCEHMQRSLLNAHYSAAVDTLRAWVLVRPRDRVPALWMPAGLWVVLAEKVLQLAPPVDAVWLALREGAAEHYDEAIGRARALIPATVAQGTPATVDSIAAAPLS
jgi:hypothetical protein